ncbi:MAG: glycosyltransferase family 2 protein, partial [Cyanobacteria bacterium J06649_11]
PVYNAEKYVADAVKSVLMQTYENLEILIIDDGSPDNSIEICQQFTDPRIKIIRQQNQGVSGARDNGIRHAQGEYLAFLDADDIWLSQKIEKHVQHLDNRSEVGISFSRSALINENGQSLNSYQMPKLKDIEPSDLLYSNPLANGSSGVFRREVFQEVAFTTDCHQIELCYFDANFSILEDIECWLRVAIQTNWKFEGIPEALTSYRVNPKSRSNKLLESVDYWNKIDDKTRLYAPEMIDGWKHIAMAYRLRDLAREAIRRQSGSIAVKLINRALVFDPTIVFLEPLSTILTLVMSYLLWLMPKYFYSQLENFIFNIKGLIQKRKIQQEKLVY